MDDKYDEYRAVEQSSSRLYDAGSASSKEPDTKRKKMIIAIAALVIIIILFRLIGSLIHKKSTEMTPIVTPKVKIQPPVQASVIPTPVNDPRLSNLEMQLESVQNSMVQMTNQLNSINSNFQSLSEQVTQNYNKLKILEAAQKKPKVVKVIKPSGVQVTFYIQAMIPGRAWLIAANGDTLTIHNGDQLPGYGVIQTIDPSQGSILTSSGRLLEYHPMDN